jgi:micrococcal nuclease
MTHNYSLVEHLAAAAIGIVLALVMSPGGSFPDKAQKTPTAVAPKTSAPETSNTLVLDGSVPVRVVKPRIPVEILRVIDGDTVEVRAQIWIDQHVTTRVRIRSIDAPERQSRCAEERAMAEAARDQLIGLIGSGPAFLTDLGRDKYGSRVLGTILTASGADVGRQMINQGHARPYAGGKRQGWC